MMLCTLRKLALLLYKETTLIVLSKIGRFTKASMSSVSYVRFKKTEGHKIKRGKRPWGKREYWWYYV